jgi:hypothetical protein
MRIAVVVSDLAMQKCFTLRLLETTVSLYLRIGDDLYTATVGSVKRAELERAELESTVLTM